MALELDSVSHRIECYQQKHQEQQRRLADDRNELADRMNEKAMLIMRLRQKEQEVRKLAEEIQRYNQMKKKREQLPVPGEKKVADQSLVETKNSILQEINEEQAEEPDSDADLPHEYRAT